MRGRVDATLAERIKSETTVGPQGELRWVSNGAVVPLGCFRDAGVQAPAAQAAARAADDGAFLAEYRATPPKLSAEDLAEALANHGPGVELVNVVTGQRVRL